MGVGCNKPVRTKCGKCPALVNNSAWTCSSCNAPNPLRQIAEEQRRRLAHVSLWQCAHCRCSNDVAIRVCASCLRAKPRFSATPAEQKVEGSAPTPAEDRKERTCVICMDKEVDHVMVPCGHLCVCSGCVKQLKAEKLTTCPVCRTKPKLVQRVYYP